MPNNEQFSRTPESPEIIHSHNFNKFFPTIEGFDTITDRATLIDWVESLRERREKFRYLGDNKVRNLGEISGIIQDYLNNRLPVDSLSQFVGEVLGRKVEAVKISEAVEQATSIEDLGSIFKRFKLYTSSGAEYTKEDFNSGIEVIKGDISNDRWLTGQYGLRDKVKKLLSTNG
jgi:hypothetical protein